MNLGEALAIAVTLAFSALAVVGILNNRPVWAVDVVISAALFWFAISLMCRLAGP